MSNRPKGCIIYQQTECKAVICHTLGKLEVFMKFERKKKKKKEYAFQRKLVVAMPVPVLANE